MFRKIMVGLLCALMLCAACAEGIDWDAMSDDEIITAVAELQQVLVDRNIEKTARLPKGKYIAGKDIPVGNYVLIYAPDEENYGNVTIYENTEEARKQLLWDIVLEGESGSRYITLKTGDELGIDFPCTLTISAGIRFE